MLVAIHQLHYLPWLRYLEKIARADVFVALDDVQYTKNGFQNRNKIKHATGWMYLTVPVKEQSGQSLDQVELAGHSWPASHWRALETNYRRAPYFAAYADLLREVYERPWTHLAPLNWELLSRLREAFGLGTPVVRSSSLQTTGTATQRLIEICRAVGADQYYSGTHAVETYLDLPALEAAGIELVPQEWRCPAYPQCFPKVGFLPDLSGVDLLFNEGPRALNALLRREKVAVA